MHRATSHSGFSSSSKYRQRRPRSSRCLHLESLEDRTLLAVLLSDSVNRADVIDDVCNLGSLDNAHGTSSPHDHTHNYLPIFPANGTDPSNPLGADIVSNALQNRTLDLGGIQFTSGASCGPRGESIAPDLNISAELFVPANAENQETEAGPYFRNRAAFRGDGIVGGSSAGYWVRLHSAGNITVHRMNAVPSAPNFAAFSARPEDFDDSVVHALEIAAQGTTLEVALDGQLQTFYSEHQGGTTTSISIPATSGSNQGTAGIGFAASSNRGQAGGQRADDVIVSTFTTLSGLPVEDNFDTDLDYGDAPDTAIGVTTGNYNTLTTDNGPSHVIVTGLRMGAAVDGESNAFPDAAAAGDDMNTTDDEDGFSGPITVFTGTAPTLSVPVTNTTGSSATLTGWIDYDSDGLFDNAAERAMAAVPSGTSGNVTLVFPTVPGGAANSTYARFRLSTDAAARNPVGAAADGEVEDYQVSITAPPSGNDFGDAPSPYPVTLAENGARHVPAGPMLGASRDMEADGMHSANADADGADEDGVTFSTVRAGQLDAVVAVNASAAAKLDAWIDFNGDGSWDGAGEQIFDSIDVSPGNNDLMFDVPAHAASVVTFARFRLSTVGGLSPRGPATDGEVEDHPVTISRPGGHGHFVADSQLLGAASSASIALGDLDGDGDLDAFVGNGTENAGAPNEVWLNDGNGVFVDSGQSLGTARSHGVALGDLDGDGDLDAFAGNRGDVDKVWINQGGLQGGAAGTLVATAQNLVSGSGNLTFGVALGDVDRDGDLDAVVSVFGDANTVWLNDGTGTFTDSGQILSPASNTLDVSLGDLDGDGDLDAFFAEFSSVATGGPSTVWVNDGAGQFTKTSQPALDSEVHFSWDVDLGDVDGDGDLDAYIVNINNTGNELWLNDGSGNFAGAGAVLGNENSHGVQFGDLDGDGDLDAFVTNLNQPNTVWINDGSGSFTASGQLLGNASSFKLALGDIDRDGDLDSFVINGANEPNTVWLNALPLTRHIFYDNSTFDTGGPSGDEAAIATDKLPLLPGNPVTFANYVSHPGGITGILIDTDPLSGTPTDGDFEFKIVNDSVPSMWPAAPSPSIEFLPGGGTSGADRIAFTWSDGSIVGQWLQVTVKENAAMKLPGDVFYVGSAPGETGDSTSNALVNGFDFAGVRDNAANPAGMENRFDFNRDKIVDGEDLAITRDHVTDFDTALPRITPAAPAPPPAMLITTEESKPEEPARTQTTSPSASFIPTLAPETVPSFARQSQRMSRALLAVFDFGDTVLDDEVLNTLAADLDRI